jgi:hypothetical protein
MVNKGEAHDELIQKLSSLDTKTTIGQDVKAVGEGLHQVLLYGRNNDGSLHPLECSGNDRLLVDVVELSAGGRITTATALSSVQICGYDTVTSEFKTIDVNSDGVITTNHDSNRSSDNSLVSSSTIDASLQIGSDIDIGTKKSIVIVGSATSNHSIQILHSTNGTDFYLYGEVSPVSFDSDYHYNIKIEDGLQHYRIMNSNQSNTFTINYITL